MTSLLRGNLRLSVWSLLCILTALIFLYPAHLRHEYAIIQSINVFPTLPIFGVLNYAWFSLILVLLVVPSGKKESRDWENVALLGMFVLVFSGIWVSLTRGANGEFLSYAAQAKHIVDEGSIPPRINPAIGATDFPGLAVLLSSIRLVTGLETFDGMVPLLLVDMLLYSTLLYVLLRSQLKQPFLASVGILILIMGSRELALYLPQLHPRGFALVLLVALLVMLFSRDRGRGEGSRSASTVLLSTILFLALTITHLVTAIVFVIILTGMYLVGIFSKQKLVELSSIVRFLVIVLGWQIYVAITTSTVLVHVAYNDLRKLLAGAPISDYFLHITTSYFGAEGTPTWVNIVRFFWLALTMTFGAVIGFVDLFKIRTRPSVEKQMVGGLVGTGLFVVFTLVFTRLLEGFRFLYYLPLFTVPIMLGFLDKRRGFIKRYGLAILPVLLLVLSVPSFLVHNDRVGVSAVYPQEIRSSEFLSSTYGNGETLQVVSEVFHQRLVLLHMPTTKYQSFFQDPYVYAEDPLRRVWENLEMLVSRFEAPVDLQVRNSVFLYSPRLSETFMFLLRIDPTGTPRWKELQDRLSRQALIYMNGFTTMYYAAGSH